MQLALEPDLRVVGEAEAAGAVAFVGKPGPGETLLATRRRAAT
jgi:hypothetical protein